MSHVHWMRVFSPITFSYNMLDSYYVNLESLIFSQIKCIKWSSTGYFKSTQCFEKNCPHTVSQSCILCRKIKMHSRWKMFRSCLVQNPVRDFGSRSNKSRPSGVCDWPDDSWCNSANPARCLLKQVASNPPGFPSRTNPTIYWQEFEQAEFAI